MQHEENSNLFRYLEDIRQSSKNKLINLGILINSGGIIGILSITKTRPVGELRTALLYFIMSICTIFLVENVTLKIASDSLREIIKKEIANEKIDMKSLRFYKTWINNLIWLLNLLSFMFGVYAINLCFNYLK